MGHMGTLLSNLGDDDHAWPARCEIGMGIGRTEERTVGQTEWGKKGSLDWSWTATEKRP